jgi:hypothetical protein
VAYAAKILATSIRRTPSTHKKKREEKKKEEERRRTKKKETKAKISTDSPLVLVNPPKTTRHHRDIRNKKGGW